MNQRSDQIELAARALVLKLDEALPCLDNLAILSAARGVGYTGPAISPELEALRLLLPPQTEETT